MGWRVMPQVQSQIWSLSKFDHQFITHKYNPQKRTFSLIKLNSVQNWACWIHNDHNQRVQYIWNLKICNKKNYTSIYIYIYIYEKNYFFKAQSRERTNGFLDHEKIIWMEKLSDETATSGTHICNRPMCIHSYIHWNIYIIHVLNFKY